jgi:hypothetical protein
VRVEMYARQSLVMVTSRAWTDAFTESVSCRSLTPTKWLGLDTPQYEPVGRQPSAHMLQTPGTAKQPWLWVGSKRPSLTVSSVRVELR